ncbi:Integrase catalytic domain-containing protein [Citrus sinensis]|uniref:Integrase catalytic domain-containing protein n=1 Tax=Citrus sinensis TaxID=2711 RepID=A0ACB8L595_CITSI|nr:Integrase catalytic domain-containing protein [Citrus sinensis]
MKMKAVLRKNNCLTAIGERPMEITDDKWNEVDGNAISDLHLALADGVLSSVAEKNTAKEIWDTLTKLYEAKSLHNKIFLKRKLYTLRMAESTMVTDHINTLKTLFSQLTTLGHNIEENERVELLLQSLPNSYDQLIINLTNNNPADSLVFDDVAAFVLNEKSSEAIIVSEGRKRLYDVWLIDSGAACHMTSKREWFHTYEPISGGSVYMGNDHALEITGIGTIKIKMFDGTIRIIGEVRHVNGLKKNLLSLGQMDSHGYKTHVENGIMKVVKCALILMKAEKIGANLFMLKRETLQEADACVASNGEESMMMWHLKLGHMSEQGLKILSERKLLPGLKSVNLPFCEHCVTSKQHRLKFSRSITRSKCILELIHSGVWESSDISMGGAKYMMTFIDDYSKRCWVYPIKKKSDVFLVFKEYKARVELESGKKIKCLRTDNSGEYTDGEFLTFCKQEGIQRQFTVAYTPQQNRVAERMNRTLTERIRAMLRTAGLPNSFWAEAAKIACYIVNRSPSTAIGLKTAMEMWTGKPADYSYLYAFGCPVYMMYNAQERTKLDPKSRRCIFLGYADGVKGYRLWDPTAHKIVISRDVIFVEDQLQMKDGDDGTVKEKSETVPVYVENNPEDSDSSETVPKHEEQELVESEAPEVRRSTQDGEPSTFHEALNSSDVALWMTTMQEEIEALHKNKTWELIQLPRGRKAIGNKWVYKIKRDGNDQVERYRARLVVKGYAQKEGIDLNEIFSPVVRLTTIRIVLAMCATFDLHLEQLDVKTTFLHRELEEEIYMLQPEGFAETGKENLVCRLSSDHCAYYKRFEDNDFIILLLYVDDMLVAANKILGMQIHRDRNNRKIWLPQKNYLKKILRRFNMQDCKSISTPLPVNFKLSSSMCPSNEAERKEMSRVPYASVVGSLMFAMICTRPDIAQAVGAVSRYMANPGGEHWIAVKRILRYIRGTSDVALCYGGSEFTVRGYVNSDFAGDLDKRKSTTGYVFALTGATVSWVSKLQTVVALSTTEAEYMAATQLARKYLDTKTKHIGVQYHFVREVVEDGSVDLQKIHTKENLADVLTKPINADKFIWSRSSCGLAETFTHEIPSEIGRLRRLQVLALNNNSIGGEIPANISRCSNLAQIDLLQNQLVGKLPSDFSSLLKIEFLSLGFNHLTGSIPSSFGNLTSIDTLYLSQNNLDGSIPDTLGLLKNLVTLALAANRLSGTIPSSIFNISSITVFEAGTNHIHGCIPLDIGFSLPNLQFFSVMFNQITGSIPPSISNASKLEVLQVTDNKLRGEVPYLEKLQRLSTFMITGNSLGSGGRHDLNFLCSLTNATMLIWVGINVNNFGGILPGCISNFSTTLEMFLLDHNKIVGSIPAGIGKFVNLQSLHMWNNQLSGTIPLAIGELQNLGILALDSNRLSGNIPPSIGNLKKLVEPYVSDNFLKGSIPSSLGLCESLTTIGLFNNNLSGTIPPQLMGLTSLVALDLSRNQFSGSFPTEVGNLINLETLTVSGNILQANLIGTGSFGSVYKGVLDEGRTTVAVKVFNLHHRPSRSFIAECRALRSIRHRNLVKVLTACSGVDYQGNDFKALVYDFKALVHAEWKPRGVRLNIAIDVASALDYLHHDCQPITSHCDLKPSNILLDEEMVSHVGDFGLARFLPPTHVQTSSIGVKGSIGYIAPEYGLGSEVSTNGDVYSYGILMLELIIRKKPSDIMFEGDMNLHNFARMALPDHVMDIVDSTLLNDVEDLAIISNQRQRQIRVNSIIECLISMLRIGVTCSMESRKDRMKMTNVVHELQSTKNILLGSRTMREMQRFR